MAVPRMNKGVIILSADRFDLGDADRSCTLRSAPDSTGASSANKLSRTGSASSRSSVISAQRFDGREQHLGRAGKTVAVTVFARLVYVEMMMRMFNRRDAQNRVR